MAKSTAPAPAPASASALNKTAAKFEFDEDVPFSVLIGPGEVKTLSLEQLVDFYRLEVIDDQTFIWQKGMSEWTQLTTILGADEEEDEDPSSDIWYVQVEPGEIKTLTLDQLDDLYRLDVVDENTLVCQAGWPRAYPLGMVAGIQSSAATAPVAPVAATAKPPTVATVQPPPVHVETKPLPMPVSLAAAASTQPSTAPYLSNAPVAMSIPVPAPQNDRGGRWLVRTAIAAGLLLTLFRNDVVYSVADAVSQKASYLDTEKRVLGGPTFGTTRAVDSLLAETGGRLKPVRLPYMVTEAQDKKSSAAKQSALAAAEAPKAPPVSNTSTAKEEKSENKAAAVDSSKSASNANVAAALTGAPTKKFAAVKTKKAAAAPRVAKKKSGGGQNGPFTGKGAYGDPLAM